MKPVVAAPAPKPLAGGRALARAAALARGVGVRQVRIACGIVMFTYLVSHFANHALGNISYAALEAGLRWHMGFWRNPVIATVFYAAALTHWGLGLWALWQRRHFRYAVPEGLQLVLGLSIPLLLVQHLVAVRLQAPLFGRDIYYAQALNAYWIRSPHLKYVQFVLLIVAWTHGCIGLYFWLRLKRFFGWAGPYLLVVAALLPTLAILGVTQGGREVMELVQQPAWKAANLGPGRVATPPQRVVIDEIIFWFPIVYGAVLLAIVAARGVRALRERRGGMVRLSYAGGTSVRVPRGLSVLEASLRHGVPHASVCGGKARCSTCRIRVVGDPAALPPPSRREAFVLERVGASADPAVRLACQLRPQADLAFYLVFPPEMSASSLRRSALGRSGEERYVVSLFVDMRRSTALAEKRLPFDTMFIINRFIAAVSGAIESAGGRPNQFLGDGVLALFGLTSPPAAACREVIDAVAKIAASLEALNRDLAQDLREPIRCGIGVNGGDVIIGDVGYREHMVFTALGDAVNVAARLQEMTKELACEAVVADEVCRTAGMPEDPPRTREVSLRGRDQPMRVRLFTSP